MGRFQISFSVQLQKLWLRLSPALFPCGQFSAECHYVLLHDENEDK